MKRLLDLYCGAGGAGAGYSRAGFEVVGVDINPQPNYPFQFIQFDVVSLFAYWNLGYAVHKYTLADFDAIHASPPCQRYSAGTPMRRREVYPDLIGPTRDLLMQAGLPYVIENVMSAPLINPVRLCGSTFNLKAKDVDGETVCLQRHRKMETSFVLSPLPCRHDKTLQVAGAYRAGAGDKGRYDKRGKRRGYVPKAAVLCELFQTPWMTFDEVCEAIPPAYTEYVGAHLMGALSASELEAA